MTTIQIQRPSNGHVLASFEYWTNYHYVFLDGSEVPLPVRCAWCARCERFVEVERLYTDEEIQARLDGLESVRIEWAVHYAKAIERAEILGKDLSRVPTCLMQYRAWESALAWRKSRESPPRCLECGSFFAVIELLEGKQVPHPAGSGVIIVTSDGTLGGLPEVGPPMYFDGEGRRLSGMTDFPNCK